MKQSFRLYRRKKVYYCQDNATGKQESLHTSDKVDAGRILHAKNEAGQMGTLNLQIARAYMVASDPLMPERTWREVIRFIIEQKTGPTRTRWENTEKDKALAALWNIRVVETRADQLLKMLKHGTVSTNVFLRRLHNYALDMNWLAWAILPRKQWPKSSTAKSAASRWRNTSRSLRAKKTRNGAIITSCCGFTGGSADGCRLAAAPGHQRTEGTGTVFYRRKKNGSGRACQRFGDRTAADSRAAAQVRPAFPVPDHSVKRTAPRNSSSAAVGWASRASRCTAIVTHGRNAPRRGYP